MRFFKETESETTRSGRRLSKKDVRKRRRATRKKLAKIALGTALAGALAFSGYKTFKKMGSKKHDTPDSNPIKDPGKHFIPVKVVNEQLPGAVGKLDTLGKQLVVVPVPNPIKKMGKHFIPVKVVNEQLPDAVFGKQLDTPLGKHLVVVPDPTPNKNLGKHFIPVKVVNQHHPDAVGKLDTLGKQLVVVPDPNPIKKMGKHFIPVKVVNKHLPDAVFKLDTLGKQIPVLGEQLDTPLEKEGDRNGENKPAVKPRSALSHAAKKGSWGVTALEALHSLGNQIKGADTFIKKHAYQTLGRLSHQHYVKHSNVHRAEPSAEMARNQLREIVNDNLEAARNHYPMSAEQWDETVRNQLPEIVNDNVEAQLPMSAEQQNAMNAYSALLEPTAFYEEKFKHNKFLEAAKKTLPAREAARFAKSKDEYKHLLEAHQKYSPQDLTFYDTYGGRRTRRARRT